MEAPPIECYSMGAINSLLEKITPLVENHPMIKVLLQDAKSLRDDLLNKFAGGRATGEQVKVWMKLAREMIYDIEDWIDMKQEAASFDESDKKQIDQFKDQIKEARDRCERYELLKHASTSDDEHLYAGASELGAGPSLRWEKPVLVGMDGPKSELLNRLKQEKNELRVISIHGMEGLGKTALAKEIYGDIYIKTQFDCQAFVSVGRTTSMKTTLMEILHQVKSEVDIRQPRSCSEVITELWRFLRTQRYFICIDDIRSTQDLEVIICSLPENNHGSRILTTTRMKEIAISCSGRPCDFVYEMVPLGEADSKNLFLNNVYVREEEWPDHFKECSNKMLEVCGGVPLAIIITAGFLERTSSELSVQSEKVRETILSELDQFYSLSQVTRKILQMSYGDLPLPVKYCFLYLAAFSGNYEIKKDRLIRRWRDEGLIAESHGKSSWETGESCFHELISRRLIQPVFGDNDDQPIGCTVHGVVFDFVELLSSEENFVTAIAKLESVQFTCDWVRRVSLDCGEKEADTLIWDTYCPLDQKSSAAWSSDVNPISDEDEAVYWHLSRVRSLAFSGDAGRIPDLSSFRHVRVLDLEDTMGLENKQLESTGCLSLLRYLGLCRTDVTKLPERIGALKLLSTLDLRRTSVRNLPELRNKKLISLLGDQLILQRGMEGMLMLEEMSRVLLGPDGSPADSMARLVHGLSQLRTLGVRFSHLHGQSATERQGVRHLIEEVGKSIHLRSLLLDNYQQPLLDILVDSLAGNNHHLQKLELTMRGCLPQIPQEIASLTALTHLHISVEAVGAEAVHALGKLPKLALLKLCCSNTSSPCLTVSSRDGFQCLKVLWYNSQYGSGSGGGGSGGAGVGFQFEVGAMPQLRKLRLDLDARGTTTPKQDSFSCFGIQNLGNLVEIHATIDWTTTTALEVEAEEAHIRELVSRYPNSPVLELNRTRRRPAVASRAAEELVIAVHSMAEWNKHIDPNKLVVIHFTTSWCPASVAIAPVFADLAKRFWSAVVFLKVDVEANDEMRNIAQQFYVGGVPTFLFIKGGDDVGRVIGGGVKQEKDLEDRLVALL